MWRIDKFVRCAQTARWCITALGVSALLLSAGQAGPASDGEYPVVLDGLRLFTIKAPRAPYNTQQRAKNISDDHLLAVAEDEQVRTADMRIVPLQTDSLLLAGHMFVLAVTDEDGQRMRRLPNCVRPARPPSSHLGSGVSWEKTR